MNRLVALRRIPSRLLVVVALLGPLVAAALVAPVSATVPTTPAVVDSSLGIFQHEEIDALPESVRDAMYTEYVRAVRDDLAHRRYEQARRLAQRATLLWPERQRPHLHLAQAEIGAQRWSPCIEEARQARSAHPDTVPPAALPEESAAAADYWEGLGFLQTQRYEEALPFLEAAAAAMPQWAEAQRALGECAFILGDAEQAAVAYGNAFQLDAEVGGFRDLSYYADAMATRGDTGIGIAALEAAARRFPYEPGLHARLAALYRDEGSLIESYYHDMLEFLVQGARGEFSQLAVREANTLFAEVEADPDNPARHELLLVSQGMNALRAGNAHEALHALQHAVTITSSSTVVPYLFLADAQLHANQLEQARHTLDQALTLHPDFVPAMVKQATVLRALGDDEAAQEMVERAAALFPEYWKLQPENLRQRG
jgi:tetratricopeptide (TPR) repeat protein